MKARFHSGYRRAVGVGVGVAVLVDQALSVVFVSPARSEEASERSHEDSAVGLIVTPVASPEFACVGIVGRF